MIEPGQSRPAKSDFSGRKIVYDEDGKPCRSCNTLLDFQLATGKIGTSRVQNSTQKISKAEPYAKDDPPDVELLGRSSWNLLHAVAASYPKAPTDLQKTEMKQFMTIFSHVYPCWWCAKDFDKFIRENAPRVDSREELGKWMCDAHNDVNRKLGKPIFDCNLWEKRWVNGWD
ncbi:LAME_0E10594g1_1 [Lachancea meyersii CBS 8951]|uniref:Sulfhydryl oxidase n=1 Tax=Lachancea meyersii CBS 8951 TaxID=1266667 RepID=A0A1G4JK60_9SACH|nr:LAME_0E10594g1_1 [Lachancea meyersii CBS 8951]